MGRPKSCACGHAPFIVHVSPPMQRLAILVFAAVVSIAATAGAWGEGSFDNDDARDWVGQCTNRGSPSLVAATLSKALGPGEIDAADGSTAVAAAEVVAAANGHPSPHLPRALASWLERQSKGELAELSPLARRALARVKDPKISELAQLWQEAKSSGWPHRIDELVGRLAK